MFIILSSVFVFTFIFAWGLVRSSALRNNAEAEALNERLAQVGMQ